MSRLFSYLLSCTAFLIFVTGGFGQEFTSPNEETPGRSSVSVSPTQISKETSASRPRMNADLALMTYLRHAYDQLHTLASFSDITVVDAELPAEFPARTSEVAARVCRSPFAHVPGDRFRGRQLHQVQRDWPPAAVGSGSRSEGRWRQGRYHRRELQLFLSRGWRRLTAERFTFTP